MVNLSRLLLPFDGRVFVNLYIHFQWQILQSLVGKMLTEGAPCNTEKSLLLFSF